MSLESQRVFQKLAFVLFCYITNHLMTGPEGNSEFCFPRISGNKITVPLGTSVKYISDCIPKNIPSGSSLIIGYNSLLELALHKAYPSSKKEITLLYAFGGQDD